VFSYSTHHKYAQGWLGVAAGPLEYLQNGIKTLRDQAIKLNRDHNKFNVVVLTYPHIVIDSTKASSSQRVQLSGTIDEVGGDLSRIKEMGADHVIFGLRGIDLQQVIDTAKRLSRFVK
jgi:hypothetical protein